MSTKITVIVEVKTENGVTTKTIIQIITGDVIINNDITRDYTVYTYNNFDLFVADMTAKSLDWKKDYHLLIIKKTA